MPKKEEQTNAKQKNKDQYNIYKANYALAFINVFFGFHSIFLNYLLSSPDVAEPIES